jgi:hypothetical protein
MLAIPTGISVILYRKTELEARITASEQTKILRICSSSSSSVVVVVVLVVVVLVVVVLVVVVVVVLVVHSSRSTQSSTAIRPSSATLQFPGCALGTRPQVRANTSRPRIGRAQD